MLDIARSAEAESSKKRSAIRPKKGSTKETMEVEADRELDVVLGDSGSDCIVVSMRE